jgi:acid phosphatase type 7
VIRVTAYALASVLAIAACRTERRAASAPFVDAGPDLRLVPRARATLPIRVTALPDTAGVLPVAISWGDGARDSATITLPAAQALAAHAYAAPGRYAVRVTVAVPRTGPLTDTLTAFVEPPGTPQVLLGAGDIASCESARTAATARLVAGIPGTVFTLGDNAYPHGSADDYRRCYQPTWGVERKRTHPVPGNHEYDTHAARSYFDYFGLAAGEPGAGYYSYDLGDWHIVALNSNLDMGPGSPQERWLRADLAAHATLCTLAYWHHARFSSGTRHGSEPRTAPLWQALYDAGADVVLSGHEHNYERFAPQTADGRADPVHGIREFVVGTGGGEAYRIGPAIANSEARDTDAGVLRLTLAPRSYGWRFLAVPGATFSDTGSAPCH